MMPIVIRVCLIALTLYCGVGDLPAQISAQLKRPIVMRSDTALDVLSRSSLALGGTRASAISSWKVSVDEYLPLFKEHTTKTVELSGGEFRVERQVKEKTYLMTSGHGEAGIEQLDGAHRLPPHQVAAIFFPVLIPVYLQQAVTGKGFSVELLNSDLKQATIAISHCDTAINCAVSRQIWQIDLSTMHPVKIDVRIPDAEHPQRIQVMSLALTDYREYQSIKIPYRTDYANGANVAKSEVITDISLNSAIESSRFDSLRSWTK